MSAAPLADKPQPPKSRKNPKQTFSRADFSTGELLGSGTFADVYKVQKLSDGAVFALKVVEKARLRMMKQTQIALRECTIMQSLKHPNIIKLYAAFTDSRNLYFLLELGIGTLQEMKNRPRSILEIKTCAAEILDSIHYLHNRNYVHRDIKPENILISDDHHMKLTDFGSAMSIAETDDPSVKALENETIVGTPLYVAPESISKAETTPASDIWSFGCLLYFLYASYPPFSGSTQYLLFQNIMKGDFTFDSGTTSRGPDPPILPFDEEAKDLIKQIIVTDPTQRPTVAQIKNHPYFQDVRKKEENHALESSKASWHPLTPPYAHGIAWKHKNRPSVGIRTDPPLPSVNTLQLSKPTTPSSSQTPHRQHPIRPVSKSASGRPSSLRPLLTWTRTPRTSSFSQPPPISFHDFHLLTPIDFETHHHSSPPSTLPLHRFIDHMQQAISMNSLDDVLHPGSFFEINIKHSDHTQSDSESSYESESDTDSTAFICMADLDVDAEEAFQTFDFVEKDDFASYPSFIKRPRLLSQHMGDPAPLPPPPLISSDLFRPP
ncbi:putative 3-phosphoinositide-dependent protein kinase 2 [Blattamonas nauphoetae]|uniref:3-phosphoinositide-dependent protein kinase 2 n=1 Tax=Blattamonas nauphoetae TaxID=2049346 RepID=A0ABQ9X8Y4_9EUKA|nr:putative 3-phosphoinositide-dependent protein kinase 2 [Blattamonas nauphoetae]